MNYNYRSSKHGNTEPYFEYSVRCDDKIAIDFIKNIRMCCDVYAEYIGLATLKPDEGFTEEAVEKINDDLTEFINMLILFDNDGTKFITGMSLSPIDDFIDNNNGVKMKPFELNFNRFLGNENKISFRITFNFESPLARVVKDIVNNILSADIDDIEEDRLMKLVTG